MAPRTRMELGTLQPPRVPRQLTPVSADAVAPEAVLEEALIIGVDEDPYELPLMEISGSKLVGLRLTSVAFERLSLLDTIVEDCEFSAASFVEANFTRVTFVRCRMSALGASGIRLHHVRFKECRIDDANFRMSTIEYVDFDECDLRNTDFTDSRLTQTRLVHSQLQQANFEGVRATTVALHHSDVAGLQGVQSLAGAAISEDQVLPLGRSLLLSNSIDIDDDAGERPKD